MARGAHLGILAPEGRRVETGTMRVEPAASDRGVAGKAVTLGMARDAAFEVLSCSLAVSQEERPLGVVVPRIQRAPRGQSGLDVAACAELTRVMAITTAGLARVGGRWVKGEKAGRVIARRGVGGIGTVTIEALGTDVATFTRVRPRIRHRPMELGEIGAMRDGAHPSHIRPLSPARPGDR
jgi:hypothetical protein